MIDKDGTLWGWENVTPRDPNQLKAALLQSVRQWHHYAVIRAGDTQEGR